MTFVYLHIHHAGWFYYMTGVIHKLQRFKSLHYYIEVAQGAIFMEQNMKFGLILGRLAIMKKKIGAD